LACKRHRYKIKRGGPTFRERRQSREWAKPVKQGDPLEGQQEHVFCEAPGPKSENGEGKFTS